MVKPLLLSLLIAHVAIPAYYASTDNPRLGIKRTITAMFLFNLAYLLALLFIYPRLEG